MPIANCDETFQEIKEAGYGALAEGEKEMSEARQLASEDNAESLPVKQGNPHWQRQGSMVKRMERMRVQMQLQQQKDEKERAKRLEAWKRDPKVMRFTLAELAEIGEASGNRLFHAPCVLAIRSAMKRAGYQLGMV